MREFFRPIAWLAVALAMFAVAQWYDRAGELTAAMVQWLGDIGGRLGTIGQ
jgi:hypothetical protein